MLLSLLLAATAGAQAPEAPRCLQYLAPPGYGQVVARTSLTHVQIHSGPANAHRAETAALDVEEPVDFVRVLALGQPVLYEVAGWPAALITDVGRGRVLFTTLDPRGWMRPRTRQDPVPHDRAYPRSWVAQMPFEFLAGELQPRAERPVLT
jgi:hypothetical protein